MPINSNTQPYVRIVLGVFSAISGMIFLSLSSFFKLQFDHSKTSEILFFGALSAVIVFLVFMAPNWGDILQKVWTLNFSAKLLIDCVFMGIVWILAFLIKYPRFDVHSDYRRSCVSEAQGKGISRGSQYILFSVGAFALLALLLSSERQKTMELGFFSVLIGLIMDTSMETPATHDGPNGWYILGSVIYCVGLVFLKHYIESAMGNGDDYTVLPERSRRSKKASFREAHRNCLVFCLALIGVVCLFLSPFSDEQFEDSTNLKGVFFIAFSLLLGFSLLKARDFIDVLVIKCHERYMVKAAVKSLLLTVVSLVIFVTKYPRFKVQSKYRESSCGEHNGKKVISQRNRFDVFSTGSFSLLALTVSCGKEQPVKLGIFTFLLELTMDASIEILGNDEPNYLYVILAAAYCGSLILAKSYSDSLIKRKDDKVWQLRGYQEQQETTMVQNARDMSFGDERPLMEGEDRDERGNGLEDVELGIENIDNLAVTREEDTDSSNEQSLRVVDGSSSHMEDGTKLLNRRQRHIAKRREKAKKEKERFRKNRKNLKDDLWIS